MELHHLGCNELNGHKVCLHQISNSMVLNFHADLISDIHWGLDIRHAQARNTNEKHISVNRETIYSINMYKGCTYIYIYRYMICVYSYGKILS